MHVHFVGDDARQRGLSKARRAEEQHMVQRFLPSAGRFYVDGQVFLRLFLPDVVGKGFRTQGIFGIHVLGRILRGHDPVFKVHFNIVRHVVLSPFPIARYSSSYAAQRAQRQAYELLHRQGAVELRHRGGSLGSGKAQHRQSRYRLRGIATSVCRGRRSEPVLPGG